MTLQKLRLVEAVCVIPFENEPSCITQGETYLVEKPIDGSKVAEVFDLDGKTLCFAYYWRFQLKH